MTISAYVDALLASLLPTGAVTVDILYGFERRFE